MQSVRMSASSEDNMQVWRVAKRTNEKHGPFTSWSELGRSSERYMAGCYPTVHSEGVFNPEWYTGVLSADHLVFWFGHPDVVKKLSTSFVVRLYEVDEAFVKVGMSQCMFDINMSEYIGTYEVKNVLDPNPHMYRRRAASDSLSRRSNAVRTGVRNLGGRDIQHPDRGSISRHVVGNDCCDDGGAPACGVSYCGTEDIWVQQAELAQEWASSNVA